MSISHTPFPKVSSLKRREKALLAQLNPHKMPRHVAVIMDGNGRWAKRRGLPRIAGHREGIKSLRKLIRTSAELELAYLTVYAFSSENWHRPAKEVSFLMGLIEEYLLKELISLVKNNIIFRVIGRIDELPERVRKILLHAMDETAKSSGMTLNVALNYGGRRELVDATRKIAEEVRAGTLDASSIEEETISQHLYTADQPDPDLMIRTSGEFRISNYLLFQLAYAEIYVTPVLWPDFNRLDLFEALVEYQKRDRRFGRV